MEIGIDSFATAGLTHSKGTPQENVRAINELLEKIECADQLGLDVFGIGEHHRKEYLDSAPAVILAAAASRTKNIHLTSAVTVLSAADPVRVFQEFATLDLISKGRAEIIAGRGSFTESFPLFGFEFEDYDELFKEKLSLLLKIRESETVSWRGRFRPSLNEQSIYPRPFQKKLPIWVGVGGSPESFVRAGMLGLPLMIAVIGGETHRFRPLVDLYKEAGKKAGHPANQLKVGLHSLGYLADTDKEAKNDFYPGYYKSFTKIGRERGWGTITKEAFERQTGPLGALLVGSPKEVAKKILHHSEALGGISRLTFQMDMAELPHKKMIHSIKLLSELREYINKKDVAKEIF